MSKFHLPPEEPLASLLGPGILGDTEDIGSSGFENGDFEQSVHLKDWTALEFSGAYVRFRPHLVRHASRFLRDPDQIEEVVQDAFLYLMTALPELDSEVGVLRFLKWKTKMLALDMIRINTKYPVAPINDHEESLELANQTELSREIERADDAAVVKLALSKLNPRQRQVIVATQLLEKPLEEVAREMELSNSALRQLLHRARRAFKVALVGEAEVTGLPASAILTIASKKAARESGKLIAGASAVFLAIAGFASVGNLGFDPRGSANNSMTISEPQSSGLSQNPTVDRPDSPGSVGVLPLPTRPEAESPMGASSRDESRGSSNARIAVFVPKKDDEEIATPDPQVDLLDASPLLAGVDEFVVLRDLVTETDFDVAQVHNQLDISGEGYSASFGIDEESESPVQFAFLTLQLPMGEVFAVPRNGLTVVEETQNGTVISYAATDFVVGDFSGNLGGTASSKTVLANSTLILALLNSETGYEVLNFEFQTRSQS